MEKNPVSPDANKNGSKPIQTDSEEIVRRHLADEDHEITDEDIRNVRIVGEDGTPAITEEAETRFATGDSEEEPGIPEPKAKPGTPWDVLSE